MQGMSLRCSRTVVACTLWLACFAVCLPAWPQRLEPARAWIASMHEWAVPRYHRFVVQGEALVSAIDDACEGGPSPSRAAGIQDRWVSLTQTWRQLEALQLGATLQRRSSRKLDFWPTRPTVIEQAVKATASVPADGPQADDAMSRWGTAAKGLPALEWLLFPELKQEPPLWRSAAHCLFARRVARGVAVEALILRDAWEEEAGRWGTARPSEVEKAVHDSLNLLVGSVELLRGKKLQRAARIVALGGRDSELTVAFDSVRSGRTRQFLLTHFEALAQLLVGRRSELEFTTEGPAVGLSDMLVTRGLGELAAPLPVAVRNVHRAIHALPSEPQQWTPARVESAARAFRELRALIDPPISQALNVTITFTDADGD
jgi:uncharacterized protein